MPDLETLLHDVRPVPEPGWAERLDARAAAGFPTPEPAWRRKLRAHLGAFSLVAAAAAACVVVVVGIASSGPHGYGSSSGATSSSSDSSGGDLTSSPEIAKAPPVTNASGGGSVLTPDVAHQARVGGDRAVIASASLTLQTAADEVESVTDRAIRLTDALGGYVQRSATERRGSKATATLTLELPSAKLDDGIAQLSKLAHVKRRSQDAQDVTDQRAALEAAVRDARADRDGLRARLRKATTDAERSRLRAQLDRATRRVTHRERAVAQLGAQVAYSAVDVTVEGTRASGAAPASKGRWTPADALRDAGRVLEVIAGVLVIALAVALPVLLLAVLAALGSRVLTRRRRERALGAS